MARRPDNRETMWIIAGDDAQLRRTSLSVCEGLEERLWEKGRELIVTCDPKVDFPVTFSSRVDPIQI